MKIRKTTNLSENLDIPSISSEQHLDKVLTFIGLIGWWISHMPFYIPKITGPDLSSLMKNQKFLNPLETIHTTS